MGKKTNIRYYSDTRGFIRDFYVEADKRNRDYSEKYQISPATVTNKRDQIRLWLGEYLVEDGPVPYLSFDSRAVKHNPLYRSFKFKELHQETIKGLFVILEMLRSKSKQSVDDLDRAQWELLSTGEKDIEGEIISRGTMYNCVAAYVKSGILTEETNGTITYYSLVDAGIDLNSWRNAIEFFSEVDPLGLIGSYILDRIEEGFSPFVYKHSFMFPALDSIVLYELLETIQKKSSAFIYYQDSNCETIEYKIRVLPLRIWISKEDGRQYILAYDFKAKQYRFYLLNMINGVEIDDTCDEFESYKKEVDGLISESWNPGVKSKNPAKELHVWFDFGSDNSALFNKLKREKRIGVVDSVDGESCKLTIQTRDLRAVKPFLRQFMGHISRIKCDDKTFTSEWKDELKLFKEMYDL